MTKPDSIATNQNHIPNQVNKRSKNDVRVTLDVGVCTEKVCVTLNGREVGDDCSYGRG